MVAWGGGSGRMGMEGGWEVAVEKTALLLLPVLSWPLSVPEGGGPRGPRRRREGVTQKRWAVGSRPPSPPVLPRAAGRGIGKTVNFPEHSADLNRDECRATNKKKLFPRKAMPGRRGEQRQPPQGLPFLHHHQWTGQGVSPPAYKWGFFFRFPRNVRGTPQSDLGIPQWWRGKKR